MKSPAIINALKSYDENKGLLRKAIWFIVGDTSPHVQKLRTLCDAFHNQTERALNAAEMFIIIQTLQYKTEENENFEIDLSLSEAPALNRMRRSWAQAENNLINGLTFQVKQEMKAKLYDVSVSLSALNNTGQLTEENYEIVMKHPKPMTRPDPTFSKFCKTSSNPVLNVDCNSETPSIQKINRPDNQPPSRHATQDIPLSPKGPLSIFANSAVKNIINDDDSKLKNHYRM